MGGGGSKGGWRKGKEGLAEKEGILMQIFTFPYRKERNLPATLTLNSPRRSVVSPLWTQPS